MCITNVINSLFSFFNDNKILNGRKKPNSYLIKKYDTYKKKNSLKTKNILLGPSSVLVIKMSTSPTNIYLSIKYNKLYTLYVPKFYYLQLSSNRYAHNLFIPYYIIIIIII